MPYYTEDPKRDPNSDNHPCRGYKGVLVKRAARLFIRSFDHSSDGLQPDGHRRRIGVARIIFLSFTKDVGSDSDGKAGNVVLDVGVCNGARL